MRRRRLPASLVALVLSGAAALARATHGDEPEKGALEKRLREVAAFVSEQKGAEELFAASFLKAVPVEQAQAIAREYSKKGGKVVGVRLLEGATATQGDFELEFERGLVDGWIAVEEKAPHRVSGLLFRNLPGPKTLEGIAKELGKLPGKVSFAVARLGSATTVLASRSPDEALAIGSSFKLYILGALLDDVSSGKRRLDEVVSLREDRRSLPSGFLQTWPTGAPVTLHTLASLMISQSDNTATDHLLHEVGRESVEKQLEIMGNEHSARSLPFLTTAEMFKIKWGRKDGLLELYLAANAIKRRELLAGVVRDLPLSHVSPKAEPTEIEKIEWFASANDLVRCMDSLRKRTESKESASFRKMLSINPGVPAPGWRYVGFKGGSEPGVMELAWLLERKDGAWFSVALGWNDPEDPVDEKRFAELGQRALALTLKLE